MTHAFVVVVKNIRTAVEEISNINGYKPQTNILNSVKKAF